jgi:hypothetical protein
LMSPALLTGVTQPAPVSMKVAVRCDEVLRPLRPPQDGYRLNIPGSASAYSCPNMKLTGKTRW